MQVSRQTQPAGLPMPRSRQDWIGQTSVLFGCCPACRAGAALTDEAAVAAPTHGKGVAHCPPGQGAHAGIEHWADGRTMNLV